MTVSLDPSLLVLHALRVKGRARAGAVAAATGLDPAEVDDILASLQQDGLVVFRPGERAGGWALTPAGRDRHGEGVRPGGAGDDLTAEAMNQAYRRFLSLNEPLKALCTDWQVRGRPGSPNDHRDPAYDQHVIARLTEVHEQAVAMVDDLARLVPRYRSYRDRLEAAHDRLLAGDRSALTAPLTDSYHDVWMELHEDLLVSLGIERREGAT